MIKIFFAIMHFRKKNYVTHNLCDDFQFQNIKKKHTNKTTKKTRFIININEKCKYVEFVYLHKKQKYVNTLYY